LYDELDSYFGRETEPTTEKEVETVEEPKEAEETEPTEPTEAEVENVEETTLSEDIPEQIEEPNLEMQEEVNIFE
jgi:hypothetical protein